MATKKKKSAKKSAKNVKSAKHTGALPTLASLLKGKSAADFPEWQLSRKAHVRWKRGELYEAFLLFDAAAQHARADRITRTASNNRAAIVLFRSGRFPAEARKRLRAVLDHYRKHKDIEDRYFVDWAMTSLLEDFANQSPSAAAFTKKYRAACKEANTILQRGGLTNSAAFPHVHMERLADAAISVGAYDVARELIASRRARKPLPRKVKQRLEELERLIP